MATTYINKNEENFMVSGWDRTINLTRVSISTTPVLEFESPEKFLYNLEQTPTVTNMLINPLLPGMLWFNFRISKEEPRAKSHADPSLQ